ncbi:hypothetical protein A0256_23070 [Mucilaginibacter sp. PAMC 26640]|nr:hypothetical protein A0256_23070 [Mucilaginibacter sp. PAMC 26640]
MSTNLKVRLFKGKTHADGTHPIQLQFYIDGKLHRKGIYKCLESDWDFKTNRVKSKVSNSSYVNNLISEKYAEHERELLKILNGSGGGNSFFDKKEILTLDNVMDQECNRFKNENKPGSFDSLSSYKKDLLLFTDSKALNISDIDLKWFKRYVIYLGSEIKIGDKVIKKPNKSSTIQKKLKTIRRIVERYTGKVSDIDVKEYKVATKKPVKQKLTSQELLMIEGLELKEDSVLDCVRDIFLLQVYLRGARIGSLLQAYSEQFKNGRYEANNSSGKNNVGSRLIPKAQVIVNKYSGKSERLFPLYNFKFNPKLSEFENKAIAHNEKKGCTALVNKYLKQLAIKAGITKPLSSHIARHTFARMAIDKINNPMVTMELLGHSSLAVHQQYLNDIRNEDALDAAADDIFG